MDNGNDQITELEELLRLAGLDQQYGDLTAQMQGAQKRRGQPAPQRATGWGAALGGAAHLLRNWLARRDEDKAREGIANVRSQADVIYQDRLRRMSDQQQSAAAAAGLTPFGFGGSGSAPASHGPWADGYR